ncbi:sugar ABC transporter substrate-binding protein [Mycobacterium sp. 21AC1]|uniref:sugar ABC transporter substrate-binding protein n=1 Tax=[Mycobacterium] appelbergii TaxID=2939269 RepID=UPI002938F883|nr:sugar ABC transporter substrate-binding protein [Mycobacterium sp. 21AC1]MDV3127014.1 sugar ABC transporter substrate-binding protein [Mycobacterium sp. 21AC1]
MPVHRFQRRVTRTAAIILGALTLTLATACGQAPGGADDPMRVGVVLFNTDLPSFAPLIAGITAKGEELGVEVDIQNGQLDPARQAQLVQQFVTRRVDAIVISASDANAIVPAVRQANAAGIPVLGVTNDIGEGGQRLTYVGSDNVAFGETLARGALVAARPDAKVAVILGALGTSSERERTEGVEKFVAAHPGMQVIAKQTANWDNAQALKVGQDLLAKYPPGTLDAIICEGPEGATAAKYAASAGRTDVKFIVGDTSQDVKAQLESGSIAATAFQNFFDQGGTAIQYAVDAASGREGEVPQPNAYAPIELYTAADVQKIPDNSLF